MIRPAAPPRPPKRRAAFWGLERSKIDPSSLDSRSDRLFRPTKSTQERSNRLLRPTLLPEMARRGVRRAILFDLGSILGPSEGRFSWFFDALPVERADSLEEEATSKKPGKTQCFYRFFVCPNLRAPYGSRSKIVPNASLERVARRIVFESCFFELRTLKMASRGVSGASLGAPEQLLERSWALLGRSWALLGGSWGALGRSWGVLPAI